MAVGGVHTQAKAIKARVVGFEFRRKLSMVGEDMLAVAVDSDGHNAHEQVTAIWKVKIASIKLEHKSC